MNKNYEKKAIRNDINTVNELHKEIARVNNMVIKETESLRIALLNLKIEDARIKENTGIVPISDQIERVINNLHDNVTKLVTEGRKELREAFGNIESYVEEKEGQRIGE
jgi:hypothetical protein